MIAPYNGKGGEKTVTIDGRTFPVVVAIVGDMLETGYVRDGHFIPLRENPVAYFLDAERN